MVDYLCKVSNNITFFYPSSYNFINYLYLQTLQYINIKKKTR